MNCRQASKFLYAFADSELETTENLEVLEHLQMCPECCRKVDAQQQLKAAIASVMGREAAPDALRESVRAAIAQESTTARGRWQRFVRRGPGIYLALAAAIALAFVGGWQLFGSAPPGITDNGPLAVAFADRVYTLHHKCEQLGRGRHNADLPRDVKLAADQMTKELRFPVLRCKALTELTGTFESADYCEFDDGHGHKLRGAHIVLRRPDGDAVSLISVPNLADMRQLHAYHRGKRDYVIVRPTVKEAEDVPTVVAWNCPKGTHIVCAPIEPDHILDLVEPLRLAAQPEDPETRTILARMAP